MPAVTPKALLVRMRVAGVMPALALRVTPGRLVMAAVKGSGPPVLPMGMQRDVMAVVAPTVKSMGFAGTVREGVVTISLTAASALPLPTLKSTLPQYSPGARLPGDTEAEIPLVLETESQVPPAGVWTKPTAGDTCGHPDYLWAVRRTWRGDRDVGFVGLPWGQPGGVGRDGK